MGCDGWTHNEIRQFKDLLTMADDDEDMVMALDILQREMQYRIKKYKILQTKPIIEVE